MISMWDAFSGDTTIPVQLSTLIDGAYDDDNHWISGGYAAPIVINVTPIPFGDRDAGIAGIELKAKTTGERRPAFMKFTGRTELNLKDRITVYGKTYKIVKKLDYTGAGFYACIGSTILEDSR